ncbi:TVP38/TMEM64 family protein [Enterococcus sp. BWB1-3]|nr:MULTISPECIES: VTT domain-containing protein [unclassified Enterococcus]MBL1228432.1 TVP38/TMEM64 family protein [Enterococcus sp. BWB1-3]MCB5954325.1 VTT domain-containing protein [Enterococcus sp. CWB-B31]
MSISLSRKIIQMVSFLGILATIAITIYFFKLGVFKDINAMRGLVGDSIFLGPLIFIFIQIIQVVIPIIPGGISCAAGVLIFGPVAGFIYNYVGIFIGSVIIFLLSKQYGKPLILSLISDKTYNNYIGWVDNDKHFERLFTFAIFFPFSPDDALCLMAGLTKMTLKKFVMIMIFAKPFSIIIYSLVLIYGGTFLNSLLGF